MASRFAKFFSTNRYTTQRGENKEMKRRVARENNSHDSRCDESEKVESPLKITPVLSLSARPAKLLPSSPFRDSTPGTDRPPTIYIKRDPSINIYKIASADGGLIQLHQRTRFPRHPTVYLLPLFVSYIRRAVNHNFCPQIFHSRSGV